MNKYQRIYFMAFIFKKIIWNHTSKIEGNELVN